MPGSVAFAFKFRDTAFSLLNECVTALCHGNRLHEIIPQTNNIIAPISGFLNVSNIDVLLLPNFYLFSLFVFDFIISFFDGKYYLIKLKSCDVLLLGR